MQLDLAQVGRGVDTVTATITVRNPTAGNLTYYVAGMVQPAESAGFIGFTPNRYSITLAAGASGTVELTWSPSSGTALGPYDFHCRLYRTATGTDVYFTAALPGAIEVVDPHTIEVQGVAFDRNAVARGSQTITAQLTLRNAGVAPVTCYLAGLAHLAGTTGWIGFSPSRLEVTLTPGETGTYEVTWAPGIGSALGPYDFLCRAYKTAGGTDVHDSLLVSAAFSMIEPYDASIADFVCSPERLELGLGTVTASVSVVNTGVETFTLYLAGLAQYQGGSGYYVFSPARKAITVDAGQTNIAEVTWTPQAGTPMGTYDLTCRLYRTPTGSDVYDEQILTSALLFYDPFTARGSVTVNLDPPGALAAGARWRIDAGAWRQSGDTVADLYLGFHHVDFLPVEGWDQPDAFNLNLQAEEHYQATVTYPTMRSLSLVRQGAQLALQWAGTSTGYRLETSSTIGPAADWAPVPSADISDGEFLLAPPAAVGFYRLGPN
jgi:hypothetical protein